jgi:hypothetical protein
MPVFLQKDSARAHGPRRVASCPAHDAGFPFFEIPNSAVRSVVIALTAGFPSTMFLSWLYGFKTSRNEPRFQKLCEGKPHST